jgi:hypothetical protein
MARVYGIVHKSIEFRLSRHQSQGEQYEKQNDIPEDSYDLHVRIVALGNVLFQKHRIDSKRFQQESNTDRP